MCRWTHIHKRKSGQITLKAFAHLGVRLKSLRAPKMNFVKLHQSTIGQICWCCWDEAMKTRRSANLAQTMTSVLSSVHLNGVFLFANHYSRCSHFMVKVSIFRGDFWSSLPSEQLFLTHRTPTCESYEIVSECMAQNYVYD